MTKSTLRKTSRSFAGRATAVIAAGGLLFGVAACSDNDDSEDAATSASASASEIATDSSEDADKDSDKEVTSADDLPEDVKKIYETEGGEAGALGAFKEFAKDGDNSLATFEKGYIASSAEAGAQPIKGMIGKTWGDEGALDNPVGLPTAPEKGNPVDGWDQSFQNGVLGWHKDESGEFSATKQPREDAAADESKDSADQTTEKLHDDGAEPAVAE